MHVWRSSQQRFLRSHPAKRITRVPALTGIHQLLLSKALHRCMKKQHGRMQKMLATRRNRAFLIQVILKLSAKLINHTFS